MKNINERGLYLACGYDKAIETEDFGIQLVLRKFEDMTQEEGLTLDKHCLTMNLLATQKDVIKVMASTVNYLLSIGIDLFNAIEQDFAINEKELK